MGDADHGHGPLLEALAKQADHAEFGDHVMDVATWYDHGHVIQHRYNAALFALV